MSRPGDARSAEWGIDIEVIGGREALDARCRGSTALKGIRIAGEGGSGGISRHGLSSRTPLIGRGSICSEISLRLSSDGDVRVAGETLCADLATGDGGRVDPTCA